MADYFEEMNRTPLAEGETPNHLRDLVILLRDFGLFNELGETNRLPPPTSKDFVKDSLPEIHISQEDAKCSVCLKEFEPNESARRLPCNHEFHSACIMPWLEKTSTCPMCRYDLPTDDEQYEAYKKEKIREKQWEEDLESLHNSMFS